MNNSFHFFLMNIPNITKGRIEIKRRTKFTKEEDDKLKEVAKKEGRKNWTKISREMGSRTAKECKDRWENYLTSEIPISANSSNEIKRAMIEIMNMENLNEICTDIEDNEGKVVICADEEDNESPPMNENDIFVDSISIDNFTGSIDFI
ncbi:hypothetical protein M9Y10_008664 [Tritrichomonas musculus]|uniref:Myb-like DNA-binding domain containing protein n=1 Tax=Tritrichomonas musculus TaxID=1915356 RepID=A0ABR2IYQ5_9EUKA